MKWVSLTLTHLQLPWRRGPREAAAASASVAARVPWGPAGRLVLRTESVTGMRDDRQQPSGAEGGKQVTGPGGLSGCGRSHTGPQAGTFALRGRREQVVMRMFSDVPPAALRRALPPEFWLCAAAGSLPRSTGSHSTLTRSRCCRGLPFPLPRLPLGPRAHPSPTKSRGVRGRVGRRGSPPLAVRGLSRSPGPLGTVWSVPQGAEPPAPAGGADARAPSPLPPPQPV